jgi:hypothetical protein
VNDEDLTREILALLGRIEQRLDAMIARLNAALDEDTG